MFPIDSAYDLQPLALEDPYIDDDLFDFDDGYDDLYADDEDEYYDDEDDDLFEDDEEEDDDDFFEDDDEL